MNIFTELELLYIIAYNLRQRGIYKFDVDDLETFLYEASCKEDYQALFLDMNRDPIDKKVRLDEAIATMVLIRGLKVGVEQHKLTARIAPLIDAPQFEDVIIIERLLNEYMVSRDSYKVDVDKATEKFRQKLFNGEISQQTYPNPNSIGEEEYSRAKEERDSQDVKKIVKSDLFN